MKMRLASLLAALLTCGACFAQPAAPAPLTPQRSGIPWVGPGNNAPVRAAGSMGRTDRKFMGAAAQSGLAEVALGQLAMQKARDPRVREYAGQLVADHQASNARLQKIAAAKRMVLPAQPARDQQRELASMQKLAAEDFDQHFLDHMVRDHQKAMDLFNQEIKGRHQDVDLKNFAQDTLIVLQRHSGEAQRLRKASGHLPG
jgi:putative membrane protein